MIRSQCSQDHNLKGKKIRFKHGETAIRSSGKSRTTPITSLYHGLTSHRLWKRPTRARDRLIPSMSIFRAAFSQILKPLPQDLTPDDKKRVPEISIGVCVCP